MSATLPQFQTPFPERLELNSGDYFVLSMDRDMRRGGGEGNVCRLVFVLDGRLEVQQLRSLLERSPGARWLSSVKLAWRLAPAKLKWRAAGKPNPIPIRAAEGEIGAALIAPDEAFAPAHEIHPRHAPALAFDLLYGRDGQTALALTWNHTLMDTRGAELLLCHLNALDRRDEAFRHPFVMPAANGAAKQPSKQPRGLMAFKRARTATQFLGETTSVPMAVLAEPRAGPKAPKTCLRLLSFSDGESKQIDEHCAGMGATMLRSLFHLAAMTRAFQAVLTGRGESPRPLVIPVPHDRRKIGALSPVFANQIGFLFYRLEPKDVQDMASAFAALKTQMIEQMRGDIQEAYECLMGAMRHAPIGLSLRLMKQASQGRIASFYFSDSGESGVGINPLFGLGIRRIVHLPPIGHPPGLVTAFSRFQGRLFATVRWIDGCMAPAEADLFERTLRSELMAEDAT